MRIQTLPENLVARIAAGEVVERPVSIVKELVENSLDARSRRIVVEVESGGKKAIRVTDDGHGMEAADVQAAFQRHATSKIRDLEDLMEISTMGFRGEALPSIAAVSRVRMRSATSPSGIGSLLLVEHGVIGKISEVSASQGTGVEVTGLFEKIPVRKKFLRSVPTELAHITNLLHRFALVRPETSFRLVSDGKPILEAPGVPRFRDRVRQVFGDRFLDVMIPLKVEDGELRLHGFVSRPDSHHSSRTRQSFFVNHRLIRDRTLSHAIQEAYERILPARRFPAVLIFLDMPPAEVDVNIHPAKTEVRFRDPSRCHDLLFNGIRDLLAAIKPFAPLLGSSGRPEPDSFTKVPDRLREATEGFFQIRESLLPETAGAPGPGR
ncbi:MAG: DNA mismatch repair endonuclease MutL, partial [Acidobacteria bacterium]|nr:DNA mismatch repair endonuclease MutL [Acidobacteriota bacterium]